jgi:hypothetical protein
MLMTLNVAASTTTRARSAPMPMAIRVTHFMSVLGSGAVSPLEFPGSRH